MVCCSATPKVFKEMVRNLQKVTILAGRVHKGHRTLIKFLLLELYTLDLLRNMALYTWHSRVYVSATPKVFKITIRNLQQSKAIGLAWV